MLPLPDYPAGRSHTCLPACPSAPQDFSKERLEYENKRKVGALLPGSCRTPAQLGESAALLNAPPRSMGGSLSQQATVCSAALSAPHLPDNAAQ